MNIKASLALLLALSGAAVLPAATPSFEPLKIEQNEIIRFPSYLTFRGITKGQAQVAVSVDSTGKLIDIMAVAYTQKGFAEEAIRGAKNFKYTPAKRDGVPHPTVSYLTFDFSGEGALISRRIDEMAELFLRGDRMAPLEMQVCTVKELDRIPTPKNVVTPFYSKDLEAKGAGGVVRVEFLIDEQGKVRMPTVLEAANDELAVEAIAAVRQWEFEAPTSHGEPVIVKANQEFRFNRQSASANAATTSAAAAR